MADVKISDLTAATAATADDLFVIVDDPAGSPVTKKLTLTALAAAVNVPVVVSLGTSSGNLATNATACDIVDCTINATSMISNPTNSTNGKTIVWRISRDSSLRVLTLGSNFSVVSGSITNTAYYRTFIRATYDGSKWYADITNLEVIPPPFTGVALLLHMDGTNGSTTFTDSSSQALTVGPNGDVQISTAQSVFGGASALFDGTGDYVEISDSSLDLDTGDFCVEGWIRFTAITDGVALVNKGASGTGGWTLYYYSGTLYFGVPYSSNLVEGAWAATTGVWYHLACTRQGTNLRLFLNGALLGTATDSSNITSATPCRIGQSHSGDFFNGYIDEVRIVKGAHVYGAAFSVPTSPLTDPV